MNFKTVITCAVLALGLGAAEASAAVTYIYIGDKLTYEDDEKEQFDPENVTGTIVLSKILSPNLNQAQISPVSFSYWANPLFFDEHTSPRNSFEFSTNSVGKITGWRFSMRDGSRTIDSSNINGDSVGYALYYAFSDTPGSWVQVAAAVPEPATWAMMVTGFFGAGAIIRGRRPEPQPAIA